MAGVPPQIPRFQLPQLEYFSGPGGRTVASERRFSRFIVPASFTAVAAGTSGSANVTDTIDPQFGYGKAVLLHDLRLTFDPLDGTSELQITGVFCELQCPAGQAFYELGFPTLTLTAPAVQAVAMVQPEILFTFLDAQKASQSTGVTNVAPGALTISAAIFVKNLDATNPHSFRARLLYIGRLMSGVLE